MDEHIIIIIVIIIIIIIIVIIIINNIVAQLSVLTSVWRLKSRSPEPEPRLSDSPWIVLVADVPAGAPQWQHVLWTWTMIRFHSTWQMRAVTLMLLNRHLRCVYAPLEAVCFQVNALSLPLSWLSWHYAPQPSPAGPITSVLSPWWCQLRQRPDVRATLRRP